MTPARNYNNSQSLALSQQKHLSMILDKSQSSTLQSCPNPLMDSVYAMISDHADLIRQHQALLKSIMGYGDAISDSVLIGATAEQILQQQLQTIANLDVDHHPESGYRVLPPMIDPLTALMRRSSAEAAQRSLTMQPNVFGRMHNQMPTLPELTSINIAAGLRAGLNAAKPADSETDAFRVFGNTMRRVDTSPALTHEDAMHRALSVFQSPPTPGLSAPPLDPTSILMAHARRMSSPNINDFSLEEDERMSGLYTSSSAVEDTATETFSHPNEPIGSMAFPFSFGARRSSDTSASTSTSGPMASARIAAGRAFATSLSVQLPGVSPTLVHTSSSRVDLPLLGHHDRPSSRIKIESIDSSSVHSGESSPSDDNLAVSPTFVCPHCGKMGITTGKKLGRRARRDQIKRPPRARYAVLGGKRQRVCNSCGIFFSRNGSLPNPVQRRVPDFPVGSSSLSFSVHSPIDPRFKKRR